jgi:hypothetical protein
MSPKFRNYPLNILIPLPNIDRTFEDPNTKISAMLGCQVLPFKRVKSLPNRNGEILHLHPQSNIHEGY